MGKILSVKALEILDSRGDPTLEVVIRTERGEVKAAAPSGASTGKHEALELRDGGDRYGGKGVLKAIKKVEDIIKPAIVGMDPVDFREVDERIVQLDGTENKSNLGANVTTAVSMAVIKAGALDEGLPLYLFLNKEARLLPVPMLNVLNGGKHAGMNISIQEFMIMPTGASSFSEAMRYASEIYHVLKKIVREKYGLSAVHVGDEGGYAPVAKNTYDVLDVLSAAIEEAGYGKEVKLALDSAASSFYEPMKDIYLLDRNEMKRDNMISFYEDIVAKYPIVSLEDPLQEEDFEGFSILTKSLGDRVQIVGDDIFVTNMKRMKMGLEMGSANALLLKVNQIGTVSEAMDAAKLAFQSKWGVVVSHRSGETCDTTIADLSLALECGQIKTGAPARGERVAKYNRLLEIEDELGRKARYAGRNFRRR